MQVCHWWACSTGPTLSQQQPNEIFPVVLLDFIVFMVCIMSTHPPPPTSEQLDKIHLMVCQEALFFHLLHAWPALFYLSPISRPVYVQWPPAASAGQKTEGAPLTHVRDQQSCHFCSPLTEKVDSTYSVPPSTGATLTHRTGTRNKRKGSKRVLSNRWFTHPPNKSYMDGWMDEPEHSVVSHDMSKAVTLQQKEKSHGWRASLRSLCKSQPEKHSVSLSFLKHVPSAVTQMLYQLDTWLHLPSLTSNGSFAQSAFVSCIIQKSVVILNKISVNHVVWSTD